MNNWAYNLDMLAQNNILDFDAPSFITGQTPRYVGAPSAPPSPYIGPPLPNAPALKQPQIDEFKKQKNKLPENEQQDSGFIKNPAWKKWAFGILAAGALVTGIWKFKSITKWVKNLFNGKSLKNLNWKNTKKFVVKTGKSIGNFFKNGWTKFTKLFKK